MTSPAERLTSFSRATRIGAALLLERDGFATGALFAGWAGLGLVGGTLCVLGIQRLLGANLSRAPAKCVQDTPDQLFALQHKRAAD